MNARKIRISIALAIIFGLSVIDTYAFTVTNNPSLSPGECTELNEDVHLYINADNSITDNGRTFTNFYLNDTFYNFGTEFVIRGTTSSINVKNNLSSTKFYVPQNYADWRFVTNYTPSTDGRYVVFAGQNPVGINRANLVPADAQNPATQVAYTVSRVRTKAGSSRSLGPVVWQYVPFNGTTQYPFGSTAKSISVEATDISKVECFNYYARWCGDGIVSHGEQCDGTAGTTPGVNTCNSSCQIVTSPPTCNPVKAGVQTTPVLPTDTLCSVGTVAGFAANGTNPVNYTWTCNNASQSVACTASYTPSTASGSFDLSIKKYIETNDAQPDAPVYIQTGSGFNYIIRVKNEGTGSTVGTTTIRDILPVGVTASGAASGAGWTCSYSGATLTCTSTQIVASGSTYPDIIVPAVLTASSGSIQNKAVVHNPNEALPCYADNRMPIGDESVCTRDTRNTDPAVIRVGVAPTGFDLSLKKYIDTLDAQPGSAVSLSNGAAFNYIIRVKNEGPQTTTGITTMRDILPAGVSASGAASGTNWNCSYSGAVLACSTGQVVSSGSYFSDITIPVIVTATAGQTVTNYATVQNPFENNPCYADNRMPNGDESSCANDAKNNDPAQFAVPGGGSSGGASHVGPSCVNSIKTCALYNSKIACEAVAGVGNCDSADAPGQNRCAAKTLTCSGPSGPTPGGPSNPNGRCGDGVLQSGEECDVVGAPWCNACKLDMTNPGANPIVDFWMKIPTFSRTRMGYSWLDNEPGKIPFSANSILVGQGTKVFTIADIVGFGIRTRFNLPLMMPADRRICLSSDGTALNGTSSPTTICTTFGEAATMTPGLQVWTRPIDGAKYVVLGNGYFQYQTSLTGPYTQSEFTGNKNFLNLFKGANQYQTPAGNTGPTLMSAFQGNTIANDGYINLVTDIGVTLAKLPVRVSSAIVATTATPVNTSIDRFVNFSTSSLLEGFLANIAPKTTLSTVVVQNPLAQKPLPTGNVILPTVTGNRIYPSFERLNGNPNILYVKDGNATINTPLSVNGIQTIIVEDGSLIIESDITYANADSSIAFIVKNGNIAVKDTVGNLAGVFVVIPGSTGGTGKFVALNGFTSQKILRIEGSLYGDAKLLFDSRLYARGTNAYDILTTGTVLTYSNRALVNPPPLLSQFLGNYSVSRVVQ